ncbi:hypothetical protein D3C81_1072840 [compost metagenome]
MVAQVFLGEADHFAARQHVQVNLGHIKRGTLRGVHQRVGAGIDGGLLTAYFARSGKTVKNHLAKTDC